MTISTIMKETLHTISQGMLVPIIVILIFLIAVSVA